jgi:hypothetical protein
MESVIESSNPVNRKLNFMTSNKGQPLLVMNDYVYRCNKKTIKKKYWTCTAGGCNVCVHTDLNNNYLCGGKIEHEHAANPEIIEVQQTREKMKSRAMNELTSIGNIYDEEMSKTTMSSTAIAIFPTIHEICE